ncbi:MAG TPA: lysylphosphatidylglycerol synthase domain-containing protein [Dongiaceae bacterium]|nr:lysylphosphatidylglycerol synthase domain-containing protein [Dongiaceae bacterium]
MSASNSIFECAFVDTPQTLQPKKTRRWPKRLKRLLKGRSAPGSPSLLRLSVRFFAAVLGFALVGYLVFRTGPGMVWKQLREVGWGFALIILLGGLAQFAKTCAWRQAFTCDITRLSWSRSFVAQLISDGAGQFGVAGKVLGEAMRISLVRRAVPVTNALSAGAIDGGLHSLTAVLITVAGITATLMLAPLPGVWRTYAWILIAVLVSVVILAGVGIAHRWTLVGDATRALARLPRLHNWVTGKQPIIDSAEHNLLTFHQDAPNAFWVTLLFNLLWHALAILEVYIILRFMGASIALGGAFVVEGLTKVINLVGAVNPGNFGTYEAGNMLITKIFGVTGTAGLTLALCRRARTFFWAGIGAIGIALMNRKQQNRGQSRRDREMIASPMGGDSVTG